MADRMMGPTFARCYAALYYSPEKVFEFTAGVVGSVYSGASVARKTYPFFLNDRVNVTLLSC